MLHLKLSARLSSRSFHTTCNKLFTRKICSGVR